jgi:antitoxin StbD
MCEGAGVEAADDLSFSFSRWREKVPKGEGGPGCSHLAEVPYLAPKLEPNMETILSDASVSITELKRNPSAVIEAADDEAVAVLVHNKPSAYLVPANTWKRMIERLEDLELAELVRARAGERRIKVKLDDL